jgi:iron complex transport system permease protein
MLVSLTLGAINIPAAAVVRVLWLRVVEPSSLQALPAAGIILDIRLPRVLVGAAVGGSLALAGVAAQ